MVENAALICCRCGAFAAALLICHSDDDADDVTAEHDTRGGMFCVKETVGAAHNKKLFNGSGFVRVLLAENYWTCRSGLILVGLAPDGELSESNY